MVDDDRSYQLAMEGRNLNDTLAAELEEKLKADENDLDSRISLLGYYGKSQYLSNSARSSLVEHIAWIVENRPHHKVSGLPYTSIHSDTDSESGGYARIKTIWLSQIHLHPNDTTILGNAAHFFLHDDKKLAEDCLLNAKRLEPGNQCWAHDLALLYQLCGPERSHDALVETERMLDLTTDEELRFSRMDDLPKRAFEAGEFEKASEVSMRLLFMVAKYKDNYGCGNAIQSAHTTLGRIALQNGDMEKAKYHLAQSAIDAWSPQTSSFGPSMDLAEELFGANEKKAVLQYLDQCKTFCGPTHRRLIKLRTRIVMDLPPDADYLNFQNEQRISFEKTCRELELQQLDLEPPKSKRRCVVKAIVQAERDIKFWSSRTPTIGEDEDTAKSLLHLGWKVEMHEKHLQSLQEMLKKLDRNV